MRLTQTNSAITSDDDMIKIFDMFSIIVLLFMWWSLEATISAPAPASRPLPNKHEINDICGEKPHELGMRRRHAVLPVQVRPPHGSLLADRVLEEIVEGFGAQRTEKKRYRVQVAAKKD
ncbi:hypothetical protein TcasGA2_TC014406 [Tribolium castaneum]|uniref:Uncharacterized protein n=1 Tax=Tribolium castaneum TaxID=7070 RepID=D6WLT2_TRICA|nr:hypothetical protein TcasGA2_TC014406 [Tribolium castaneum]